MAKISIDTFCKRLQPPFLSHCHSSKLHSCRYENNLLSKHTIKWNQETYTGHLHRLSPTLPAPWGILLSISVQIIQICCFRFCVSIPCSHVQGKHTYQVGCGYEFEMQMPQRYGAMSAWCSHISSKPTRLKIHNSILWLEVLQYKLQTYP